MSDSSQMQPGWYYAQGDAPGTQRYWDGTQWVGAPQPVGGAVEGAGGAAMSAAGAPVEFGPRAMGWLVDVLPAWILAWVGNFMLGRSGIVSILGFLLILGSLGYVLFNKGFKMGGTGQSIGKGMQNTKLVSDDTGQPIGVGMGFARLGLSFAAIVVTCGLAYIVDHLWPLWDPEKKRLLDKILKTSVVSA